MASQEQRCRSYAVAKGYSIAKVFLDEGVSGALLERPGVRDLLTFLKQNKGAEQVPVIVDDISRIARSVSIHIALSAAVTASGGRLESPSFKFEQNAMGEMIEVIFAAVAQYGRSGNREQVINRQRSRLEMGFWTFPAPPGYKYVKGADQKKLLVPDPRRASVVREVLEGFGSLRFWSKHDAADYLHGSNFFADNGGVHKNRCDMAAHRILASRWFYAGYVEYAPWDISRRRGAHDPIISETTLAKVEDRLIGKQKRNPIRNDISDEFVLRNFVRCEACGRPLTAHFAKGKYPRYHCYNQHNCPLYGQTTRREDLHTAFEALLRSMEVSKDAMGLISQVAEDTWNGRVGYWEAEQENVRRKIEAIDSEIDALALRAPKALDPSVALAYERQISLLSEDKAALVRSANVGDNTPDFRTAFSHVSTLLHSPYTAWITGSAKQKRTVCRIAFSVPPRYSRKTGFSTINYSLPYQLSTMISRDPSRLVEVTLETWYQMFSDIAGWMSEIQG